jgi:hypothetical protein
MHNINEYLDLFFPEIQYAWPETIAMLKQSPIAGKIEALINEVKQKHSFRAWLFWTKTDLEKVNTSLPEAAKIWLEHHASTQDYRKLVVKILKDKMLSTHRFLNRIPNEAANDFEESTLSMAIFGVTFKDVFDDLDKFAETSEARDQFFGNELILHQFFLDLDKLLPGLNLIEEDFISFISSIGRFNAKDLVSIENHHLQKALSNFLIRFKQSEWQALHLDDFFQKQAENWSTLFLDYLYKTKNVELKNLKDSVENFKTRLINLIINRYQALNYYPRPPQKDFITQTLEQSCQKILSSFETLADTHAFIQGSGFATQNEYSHLALIDIINYYRYSHRVKEIKTILNFILRPLLPIYHEILAVSSREHHYFQGALHFIFALAFITAFIFFGLSALNALLYPELVSLILLIPIIYIGLTLLAQIVQLKNYLYHQLEQCYYGNFYNTPFFQINPRMENFFNEHALEISEFYIQTLRNEEALITQLSERQQSVGLNQSELTSLKQLQSKQKIMLAEWIDIHNNKEISKEQAQGIVIKRLYLQENCEHQAFGELLEQIKPEIQQSANDLITCLFSPKPQTLLAKTSLFHQQIMQKTARLSHLSTIEHHLTHRNAR